jgi:hypothetical protein
MTFVSSDKIIIKPDSNSLYRCIQSHYFKVYQDIEEVYIGTQTERDLNRMGMHWQ